MLLDGDAAMKITQATPAFARMIQRVAALGGLAALLYTCWLLPYGGGTASGWVERFFVVWCVAVPYWHFFEHQHLLERGPDGQPTPQALQLQRLSQVVWLGGVAALAAFVARG